MSRDDGDSAHDRRWWVLAGSCAGLTVLMLDSTVINLALPELQRALDASAAELQWMPNAYLLAIAATVVTAGRLGDIYGRRRVYLVGMVLFGLGSVLGGLAQDPTAVIGARVVQGLGAASLLPLSLTLVTEAFPPSQRARAMGIWASVSGVALALGPIIGGVLAGIDWRLIFWINLPVVVFGFLITRWAASETRDETAPQRVDLPGMALLTIGLVAFVLGLVQGEGWGWDSTRTLGSIGGGVLALAAFVAVELRVENPTVDLSLFRNGPYFGASAAAFALVGSYWVVMFFEPQYLQNILGYSAAEAGLLILPITAPIVLLSPVVHRMIAAHGARTVMTSGMALGFAGLLVMSRIDAETGYGILFAGFLLFGIGTALVYAPMQTAAMEAMPDSKAGIASGVLAMNRIMSGAVALAISGAIFHALLREKIQALVDAPPLSERDAGELEGLAAGTETAQARLAEEAPARAAAITEAVDEAVAFALSNALLLPAALAAIGGVLCWAFVRGGDERSVAEPKAHHHHWPRGRFHIP
jgi:EmrB/QacA subfamily drug resistance transporter